MLTHRLSQYINQIHSGLPVPGSEIWIETQYFFTECHATDAFQDENISLEISTWQDYKCMWLENTNITVILINMPDRPVITWMKNDDIYIYDINDSELIKFDGNIHSNWIGVSNIWNDDSEEN
jgi:hypothetical protein